MPVPLSQTMELTRVVAVGIVPERTAAPEQIIVEEDKQEIIEELPTEPPSIVEASFAS